MNDLTYVPPGTRIFVDASVLALHSLIVAVMQRHRLRHLATHDRDFARVSTLHVWCPIPVSP